MPSYMIFQVSLCDKMLTADLTLVIPLAEVALQVNIKVSLFCEFVSTELALIWLDSQMFPYVNLKSRLLRIADPANIAFKGLNFKMIKQMSF